MARQQRAGWGFFRLLGLALICLIFFFIYTHGPEILSHGAGNWRGSIAGASNEIRDGIRADMNRARVDAAAKKQAALAAKQLPDCEALEAAGDPLADPQPIHVGNNFVSKNGIKCRFY